MEEVLHGLSVVGLPVTSGHMTSKLLYSRGVVPSFACDEAQDGHLGAPCFCGTGPGVWCAPGAGLQTLRDCKALHLDVIAVRVAGLVGTRSNLETCWMQVPHINIKL